MRSKHSKQFHVRLDDSLLEDLDSEEILVYYGVENTSQLARKVLRKAVDEAKGKSKPREQREEEKVEFRVG